MHYRDDVNPPRLFGVEYPVRKMSYQRPSDSSFKNRPCFGERDYSLDGRIHFICEIITKFYFNLIVVTDCFIKFCFCFRME